MNPAPTASASAPITVPINVIPATAPVETRSPARPILVLDTNVCLDLFVFRDRHTADLLQALQQGTIQAITRADCRDEWLAVLHYRHLALDDAQRASVAAEFDHYITCVAPLEDGTRLPVCTDKDDQKFLQLARDAKAHYLLTKDKALLKLARKTAKIGLFSILLPQAWNKLVSESSAASA
ncbi:MAG: putative toxin-antitoxin system toxin component, PIN family [Burkholderiales bacterium]|nr:putative toxin-antitoxin system toxin component, PIN family [Burkholderiales bacterium]